MAMENYYKIGGSLRANHPTYVTREADKTLLNYLKQGEYCFVLNSRQMGKSSLRVSMTKKLTSEGIKCANIDITLLGSCVTPEQWYKGIAEYLLHNLNLEIETSLNDWWNRYQGQPEVQIIYRFFELILKQLNSQKLVIFIDEIDSLIKVNFKDDFFAFVRACYNQRAENHEFERLCFCLLGVASPNDLITDKTKTPLNIGRSIDLTGFTFVEAKTALLPGLATKFEQPETLLQEILNWTGGQPFLTQKLCNLVVQQADIQNPNVQTIVENYILQNWESQDEPEHLRTIRDRMVSNQNQLITLLSLYQKILQNKSIIFDNSSEQFELRLTGLVVKKENHLVVYNPIYETIFNLEWSNYYLETQRPYNYALKAWIASQKDSTFLLEGESLESAQKWSKDKILSNLDYEFLGASQSEQNKKENQILAQANKILAQANKKAKRIIKYTIIFSLGIIIATTFYTQYQINRARQITELEKIGNNIDKEFTFSQLESLIEAIKAGKKLKSLVHSQQSLSEYPTVSPISALLNILRQIQVKNEFQLQNYTNERGTIGFSPDGTVIAATNKVLNDQKEKVINGEKQREIIQFWHPIKGTLMTTVKPLEYSEESNPNQNLKYLRFSPDSRMIAGITDEKTVNIWNRDGIPVSQFKILNQQQLNNNVRIRSLEFSPDSQSLAIPTGEGNIQIWSVKGQLLTTFYKENKTSFLQTYSISFSPNGQRIASGSEDGKIRIWQLTGKLDKIIPVDNGDINSVIFSPQGNLLAAGDGSGNVSLWALDGKLKTTLKISKRPISNLKFSPNGQMLAVSDIQGIVEVWSLTDTKRDKILYTDQEKVNSLYFSQDSQKFTIGSQDGKIKTWQLPSISRKLMPTRGIAFNPDSKLVILTNIDGTIELRKNGNLIKVSKEISEIKGLFFHPDNHTFITAREDGIIQQWSEKGVILNTIIEYPGEIRDIAFNAVNKTMAIANGEGAVIGYTLRGEKQQIIIPKDYNVRQFSFYPQGKIIAFVNQNNGINLWDSESQKITLIENSTKQITDINFNQDGSLFAVSYQDGTLQMWTSKGTPFLISIGEEGSIASFDFKSNKNTLIITDDNGNISSFDLTIDALLQKGCNWLQDYFQSDDKSGQKQSVCPETL